ncbi:MAG: OsmC family protein [Acidimicrobiia bacterium]|nr:OsmC family protein [Acidimicrobiia bacterium]
MATEIADGFDMGKPIMRRKVLTAVNYGTMMTDIDFGEYGVFVTDEPIAHGGSGEGPSPLQAVLGALCGCESVTFHRTATEYGFAYERIDFEAAFTIDIRGRLGQRGVTQHFQTVKLQATVTTSEPIERLTEVVAETEARCPVFNLISDAGVNLEVNWVRIPPDSGT